MMDFLHIVVADEIDTVAAGSKPFSVALIDGDGADAYASQQIVGKIGTVVSRNFHLR